MSDVEPEPSVETELDLSTVGSVKTISDNCYTLTTKNKECFIWDDKLFLFNSRSRDVDGNFKTSYLICSQCSAGRNNHSDNK